MWFVLSVSRLLVSAVMSVSWWREVGRTSSRFHTPARAYGPGLFFTCLGYSVSVSCEPDAFASPAALLWLWYAVCVTPFGLLLVLSNLPAQSLARPLARPLSLQNHPSAIIRPDTILEYSTGRNGPRTERSGRLGIRSLHQTDRTSLLPLAETRASAGSPA